MNRMKFRGFKLFYENQDSAESMVRQIDEFPSFFTPSGDRPLIIDCGANIGVSVLEWKTRWPGSQVICFEPDPFAFKLLEKNVSENDVPGVQCINAAVSDCDGTVSFFGNVSSGADSRGNSIDSAWGQRDRSTETTVACQRLSAQLKGKAVSFLKLDIEGAEQRVLTEIADQLNCVEAIYVEIHETDASITRNSAAAIEAILAGAGFTTEVESGNDEYALPAHLDSWRVQVGARQSQLMGWR